MIIYKITNRINGKVYIGQTIRPLNHRWLQHCNAGTSAIHNAIQKYGRDNFEITVIDHAHSREELDNKEIFWIEFYDSLSPNGYNLETGGNKNHTVVEETRKKISESKKGTRASEETRRKMSEFRMGRPKKRGYHLSEETCRRMSESMSGRKKSKQHCENISNGLKGHFVSDETRRKISEARKGSVAGGKNPTAKRVICLETGEIFDCIKFACEKYNIPRSTLAECLRNGHNLVRGLTWDYVNKETDLWNLR